ncbi:urease accessory protein UreD [Hydrogenophaga taeniospiralis CCUG 15921]|uniref:Urease accessory protein UreD n=1 Tax=Hydrogenophaga taeniospiralis CCUG 15921 TaxID=1281780 RepID=A0A9X4NRN3_9BURK|nr:urease accessory protein UreD [Hydrogenophaga taeniospiralis]MDG5976132.1 urease accessory protein UreD [Hydrogenophaga taeniospiralis CCUG 15921]
MPWHASLSLDYRLDAQRTVLRHEHDGPLRIFKSLYPEGDAICHNVLIHPPGGLVGGDVLDVKVHVGSGAHGLISTPGATRFYASDGLPATQQVALTLDAGARLEWLPLEALAYPGCAAHNTLRATLAEGAELMAWDVTALGLPLAGQPFTQGCFSQRLEIPGLWLEQARIDAADTRLLASPLGLGGQRCLGTLLLASGTAFSRERREQLLEVARAALEDEADGVRAGATCPNPQMLVVRAVAPLVEPLMARLQRVWAALRPAAWGLGATPPRIWRV